MRNVTDWGRLVAAALVAVLAASPALASGSVSGRATASATAAEPAPHGDPLLGVLLIIGIIGVLILAAWVFSRVSDSDDAHPSDKSIV